MHEIGIFARTFRRPTLSESLDAVRAHGFRLVHFNFSVAGRPTLPERSDLRLCAEIRRQLDSRGLRMAGVSATYNIIHPDRVRRATETRRARGLIESCHVLGTSIVTLCAGSRDPADMWARHAGNDRADAWADLRSTLSELLGAAEDAGITLAIEPEPGTVVSSARRARQLLDEVDSRLLALVLDPANLAAEVPAEAVELLADRIVMVHAKGLTRGAPIPLIDYDLLFQLLAEHRVPAPVLIHDADERDVDWAHAFLAERMRRTESA